MAFLFALKAFDLTVFATTFCMQCFKTSSNWVCLSGALQLLRGNDSPHIKSKQNVPLLLFFNCTQKAKEFWKFLCRCGGLIYFLFNFSIFIWWFCEQDLLLGLKGECFVTATILVIIPEFQVFSSYSSVLLTALQFFKMTPENSELGPKMLQINWKFNIKKKETSHASQKF